MFSHAYENIHIQNNVFSEPKEPICNRGDARKSKDKRASSPKESGNLEHINPQQLIISMKDYNLSPGKKKAYFHLTLEIVRSKEI